MATGDSNDIQSRIISLLPNRWFPSISPVLAALISGVSTLLSFVYALILYAQLQTRLATMTDGFLDLFSQDFFGGNLPRRTTEQDTPFRTRIKANLFTEKGTRKGMITALVNLTGRTPIIFEPWRSADTGAWSRPISGWSSSAGAWGSLELPHQAFITAYRPAQSGIPNVIGWAGSAGGWSTPSQIKWSNLSQVQGFVTDADVYATIDATKEAGTTMWVKISN